MASFLSTGQYRINLYTTQKQGLHFCNPCQFISDK
ncbi:hypothetical protein CLOLEP_03244 [[Clostridium] leptum DSM 753]|uniref:Uncharacterized protein n=1 Tax=[Clostridium] leptum DSM 753 TaxID=428125 RepID=A7VXC1_9FIRM|nr:hypothetical protein CLOLEP_03244 [[Clostridium] leptum DSM 753]